MKLRAKDMILVALFTALTAIGAFIKVPIPYIPITLQYFFCAFAGILLGSRLGALSQILYVALGLAGLPIFTQGGGVTYIFKPSFGYLIGFIIGAFVIGLITERLKKVNFFNVFGASLAGLFSIYAIGLVYFYVIMNFYLAKPATIWFVFYAGFLTTIGGDLLKSVIIALICLKLIPALRKSGLAEV